MANLINFINPESSKLLVKVIAWLVGICGSVWLGVIVFTLALKVITLPFDFISRSKMRKNSILMEEMRPDLEKLQKQYANNKQLYNQKMMALYKRNGYSMWGACLPTIITLVIFIVAISAFTNYSNFQNQKYFYEMSLSYNQVVYEGFEADGEYIIEKDGTSPFNDDKIFTAVKNQAVPVGEWTEIGETGVLVLKNQDNQGKITSYAVKTENGYMIYKRTVSNDKPSGQGTFEIIEENLDDNFTDYILFKNANSTLTDVQIAEKFILGKQQEASAKTFREQDKKFLWVKNIWVTDSATKHPIETNWDNFKSAYKYPEGGLDPVTAKEYESLIAKLDEEKTQPNGYFILVALTALSSLLTQWITSKSQKAQMELQTVDGQGAQTNKIMMWMMPIMMAIFAFIYTAAFSLYIVLNSVVTVLTTLLINVIVEKKYKKQQEAVRSKQAVIRGRVYVPKKEEEKPKEEKKKKKEEIPANDFLSGLADKKKGKKF